MGSIDHVDETEVAETYSITGLTCYFGLESKLVSYLHIILYLNTNSTLICATNIFIYMTCILTVLLSPFKNTFDYFLNSCVSLF